MKPTGLSSDSFKFYIRRLKELGYIEKGEAGDYSLTIKGKELANNLDEETSMIQKQPKLSVLILARRPSNTSQFLFQRRLRHPYYNFYGAISGPVKWGEEIETTAKREFAKQTGLDATCTVTGFYRQKDFDHDTGLILEDKLFAVIEAIVEEEALGNAWSGGYNEWMTLEAYRRQEKRFPSTDGVLQMRAVSRMYASEESIYRSDQY